MAYNFGGKQQPQQSIKQPSKIKGKGSGVTIDEPVYKPTKPQPEPPQPQKQPTNTNVEGNVSFNKTIYSRTQFDRLVGNGFEELTQKQDDFNTDQFFDQYNRLFFDISKEGTNSHRTLVENSSEYLSGFADPRDEEIARLNETVADLQVQLATANTEVNAVQEHPFFKNGTIVTRQNSPYAYYMDKGFKRLIGWSEGDTFWHLVYDTLGYKVDINEPPEASVSILNQIPNGSDLTPENFGQEFIPPSQGAQDAEQFIINLDPEDAVLDPSRIVDLYGNDFGAYKIALEKDYQEKTSAIDIIEDKIANPNISSEEKEGLQIGLSNLISRRNNVEQILANFDNAITGAILVNLAPDFASNVNFNEPGFDVKYSLEGIKSKLDVLYPGISNPLREVSKGFVTYISNISIVKSLRDQDPNLSNSELYHALWLKYINEAQGIGNINDSVRAACRQAANAIYSDFNIK